MMKTEAKKKTVLKSSQVGELLGQDLIHILTEIHRNIGETPYLTGGTVRDLVMNRKPADIDLTVREDAKGWASKLVRMTGGTYVALGRDEDAARVVWQGRDIDFSSYRDGAVTIDEELTKRDITVNSMAVSLKALLCSNDVPLENQALEVVDPVGGLDDIVNQQIRVTSGLSFTSDPLRLLRVFRFAATLGFLIHGKTLDLVALQKEWISRSAPERVSYELNLIMGSGRAHRTLKELADTGLLFEIIPELKSGVGMEQPSSHHLDVFDHCLATLEYMEKVQKDPDVYFPQQREIMERYLATGRHRTQLKWAALFHDLGKPSTVAINEDKGGRITFYNHDREGMVLVGEIARRLRWSSENTHAVGSLVGFHMRPFFLGNDMRQGKLSLKACLRLIRLVGAVMPGLFLLSMADALAGKGENRPEKIELEVAELFERLEKVRKENVEPVRTSPPLLNGKDLIEVLNLKPGPLFKELLDFLEEAHMENIISSRREALAMARDYLNAGKEEAVLTQDNKK